MNFSSFFCVFSFSRHIIWLNEFQIDTLSEFWLYLFEQWIQIITQISIENTQNCNFHSKTIVDVFSMRTKPIIEHVFNINRIVKFIGSNRYVCTKPYLRETHSTNTFEIYCENHYGNKYGKTIRRNVTPKYGWLFQMWKH